MIKDGWELVDEETGMVAAQLGAEYRDFRGDTCKLIGGHPPVHEASTGRVATTKGTFYPSVIGMKWVKLQNGPNVLR